MSLRIVGAGLGRTGTHSLKLALEQLLGAPCYHMVEVFAHPDHIAHWRSAIAGEPVDWDALMGGYAASVDWPAAAFWRELVDANPESMRADEAHNAAVRAAVPADRLVDWRAGEGWEPICEGLGIAVPAERFPHVNTTDEFRRMTGLDE